jgi:glycosyltransferase involved in cell wall biosynthesis
VTGVYTLNSAALELLDAARTKGIAGLVEQTIAPRKHELELLHPEAERFPGWEPDVGEDDYSEEYMAREAAEWRAARTIICGSEFVRSGIERCGGPVNKCVVIPYGIDIPAAAKRGADPNRYLARRPLRVLTVGAVGLRKGSPHVLGAARLLKGRAEFRMVGPVCIGGEVRAALRQHVDVIGPVPRSEVSRHFRWADVFLLPSICEGSATATYEALGHGLPVVCTPNTGSVVRDGIDGFLIPPGSHVPIVEKLVLLAGDRHRLAEMSARAEERSQEFTIASYGQRLLGALSLQKV